jgi:hypothetical protein
MSSAPFRRVNSRALRAASRAAAASTTLPTRILASEGCSSSQTLRASLTRLSTTGRTSEDTSLSLVCEENLGSGTFTDSTAVSPSRQSSPVSDTFFLLGDAGCIGIGGDLTRERAAEAGHMRAAVALRNVVGEAQHVLVIAVVPPHCDFDGDAVLLAADRHRLLHERLLRPVEIGDEGLETAVIHHFFPTDVRMALVGQHDAHAGIQEGEFAQSMLERAELELDVREGLFARREGDLGSGLAAGVARHLERPVRYAVGEAHFVDLAGPADLELQRHGEGVDDRNADAVQATGDLVGILVEFSRRHEAAS